jgi:3-hydroxyisobutyrate dehydrogenase-like beta-hydroxyacid dehydrogenase
VLGARLGLDPMKMLDALNHGTGQNSATLTKIPDHVVPRTFDYGGRLDLVCKDLGALVAQAGELGEPMPLAGLVEETYRRAVALGSGQDDMSTIIRHMEDRAGVIVKAAS